jgi:hypothetical protein
LDIDGVNCGGDLHLHCFESARAEVVEDEILMKMSKVNFEMIRERFVGENRWAKWDWCRIEVWIDHEGISI